MPIHDWTRVAAGIFHHFHHGWIEELARALNQGILSDDYYAMAEQQASGFGPDVLALQELGNGTSPSSQGAAPGRGGGRVVLVSPKFQLSGETEVEFLRRRKSTIVVRHVSGDRTVAMVEVVSPGNKASRHALRAFVAKAMKLFEKRIHLAVLDLHPPGRRDPQGIHAAIGNEAAHQAYVPPASKPLTLASYACGATLRAFVEPVAVGDVLADMPLFLQPGAHVLLPLEATYQAAFAAVPRRWRGVLDTAAG